MVVVDLEGNKVEGKYNPSMDTATATVAPTIGLLPIPIKYVVFGNDRSGKKQ